MGQCRVVIETRGPGPASVSREAFEVTPAPARGTEREVLAQLVAGIHPGARERAHDGGRSVFDDAGREIVAHFERAADPPGAGAQATLFDD